MEQALKIASHITHPVTAATFALAFTGIVLYYAITKKRRTAWALIPVVLLLGLAPIAASTVLQLRGLYRVRVTVLGPDKLPVENALITSSSGGEPKRVDGGWEFDIPPQIRPADGKVVLIASVKSAFLTGSSTVILAQDFYPITTIQLTSDTSATVRGVVVDERSRSVAGATVSIAGYNETVLTDSMGNFVLPAHAADGQIVQVRAQKKGLVGNQSVPAGRSIAEIIVKRQ